MHLRNSEESTGFIKLTMGSVTQEEFKALNFTPPLTSLPAFYDQMGGGCQGRGCDMRSPLHLKKLTVTKSATLTIFKWFPTVQ